MVLLYSRGYEENTNRSLPNSMKKKVEIFSSFWQLICWQVAILYNNNNNNNNNNPSVILIYNAVLSQNAFDIDHLTTTPNELCNDIHKTLMVSLYINIQWVSVKLVTIVNSPEYCTIPNTAYSEQRTYSIAKLLSFTSAVCNADWNALSTA